MVHFHPQRDSPDKPIRLPQSVLQTLTWWTVPNNLNTGTPFQTPHPTLTLYTDASLIGWDAVYAGLRSQGTWNRQELSIHINYLELLAIFKALRSFEDTVRQQVIQITSDSMVAVFYINKQGGTKSVALARLSVDIWEWCILRGIILLAVHLAGTDNEEADEQGMGDNLFQSGHESGVIGRRPHDLLVRHQNLCLPSYSSVNENRFENHTRRCHGNPDYTLVAPPSMVFHPSLDLGQHLSLPPVNTILDNSTRRRSPPSILSFIESHGMANSLTDGTDLVPRATRTLGTSTHEPEVLLAPSVPIDFPTTSSTLDLDIQRILESALRPSTRKSYAAKWRRFSSFADSHSFAPESGSIENVLQFLLKLHRLGLKPSSIKVYAAAISHYRGTIQGSSVFSQPLIRRFLKGLQNLHPSIRPVMPTWSLSVVLQALTRPPFEPLATVDLRLVSWKTAFLVAVTSARRASELCALSCTESLRLSNRPFVKYSEHDRGSPVSSQRLSKWIVQTIESRSKTSAKLRLGLLRAPSPDITALMCMPDSTASSVGLSSLQFFSDETALLRVWDCLIPRVFGPERLFITTTSNIKLDKIMKELDEEGNQRRNLESTVTQVEKENMLLQHKINEYQRKVEQENEKRRNVENEVSAILKVHKLRQLAKASAAAVNCFQLTVAFQLYFEMVKASSGFCSLSLASPKLPPKYSSDILEGLPGMANFKNLK
ncbi:Rho-associated protein kinase 1 [Varanus komodoensis]|nr:Rho-associated protein kinase 1 [Varanus komodoensis]